MATHSEGLLIGYELFEGNRAEVTTLIAAVEKWCSLFYIKSVCFVGNRAMFCEKNIKLLEENNFQYIVAAKLRGLSDNLKGLILDKKNHAITLIKDWKPERIHAHIAICYMTFAVLK